MIDGSPEDSESPGRLDDSDHRISKPPLRYSSSPSTKISLSVVTSQIMSQWMLERLTLPVSG
jgi:hypothetical protein